MNKRLMYSSIFIWGVICTGFWYCLITGVIYLGNQAEQYNQVKLFKPPTEEQISAAIVEKCNLDTLTDKRIPILRLPPSYPLDALVNSVDGWVDISYEVAIDGSIANTRIMKSNPKEIFDDAALEAVNYHHYCPISKPITSEIRIRFEMEK